MTDEPPMGVGNGFAEIGRIRLGETNLDGVLDQLSHVTKRVVVGAAEVSVTLGRGKAAYTAAFTGDLALVLDETQYAQGHGPCLHALASGKMVLLPDMAAERRWPDFAAHAVEAGCGSSLSIGLPVHDSAAGALNIYATAPAAFNDDAVTVAQTVAGYSAAALANVYQYEAQAARAQHMQAAMAKRATIEQAKGIIMGNRRCTPDEAFAILTRLAQDTNRKLRDVAQALVDRAPQTPLQ